MIITHNCEMDELQKNNFNLEIIILGNMLHKIDDDNQEGEKKDNSSQMTEHWV